MFVAGVARLMPPDAREVDALSLHPRRIAIHHRRAPDACGDVSCLAGDLVIKSHTLLTSRACMTNAPAKADHLIFGPSNS